MFTSVLVRSLTTPLGTLGLGASNAYNDGIQRFSVMFKYCKTFHRKSFFHLAEVLCFQIQTEFQIDGTCGKLRDAYQAGYSVLLKSL